MMRICLLLSLFAAVLCQTQHPPVWEIVFDSIDLNHDGKFSMDEFHILVPKFDLNHDQSISEAEFMTVWDQATSTAHDLARDDAAGRKLFKMEDRDGDGNLSRVEVTNLFSAAFDANKDNIVTKLEFQIEWFKIHDHSGHNPTGPSVVG